MNRNRTLKYTTNVKLTRDGKFLKELNNWELFDTISTSPIWTRPRRFDRDVLVEAVEEAVNALRDGAAKIRVGWKRDALSRPITPGIVAEVASVLVFVLAKQELDKTVRFRCRCRLHIIWQVGGSVTLQCDFALPPVTTAQHAACRQPSDPWRGASIPLDTVCLLHACAMGHTAMGQQPWMTHKVVPPPCSPAPAYPSGDGNQARAGTTPAPSAPVAGDDQGSAGDGGPGLVGGAAGGDDLHIIPEVEEYGEAVEGSLSAATAAARPRRMSRQELFVAIKAQLQSASDAGQHVVDGSR